MVAAVIAILKFLKGFIFTQIQIHPEVRISVAFSMAIRYYFIL